VIENCRAIAAATDLPVNADLENGYAHEPRAAAEIIRLAAEVGRLLRHRRPEGRVMVSSFDYGLLLAFRLAAPEVPVGLLFAPRQRWELRQALGAALGPSAVCPQLSLASDERIAAWGRRGLSVVVWTVDEAGEQERLARAGVAAVVSNAPGPAREAVRRATGS